MAQVEISEELYNALQGIVNDSNEFTDVSVYVEYILQQVVDKKKKAQTASEGQDSSYSKEDEDKIRDRLKNLGYLD